MDPIQTTSNTPPDLEIKCIDCNASFTWTGGDQLYFRDRELATPKRCMKCRKIKKDSINQRKSLNQHYT